MNLIKKSYTISETIFEIAQRKAQIRDQEAEIEEDSFWADNTKAQSILASLSQLKKSVQVYDDLIEQDQDLIVFFDMAAEDSDALNEIKSILPSFCRHIDQLEIESLLSGKYDTYECLLSINAGAGGTDAQDWAIMLLRMYLRWIEKSDLSATIIEQNDGDEAGIKSATLLVSGPYAYGYLKNEIGVHRLVRLSPFNANNKRQTSFASVDVIPKITADFSSIDIDPKELRIDTFRSSGAGGQHVNKTDSAVRITHLPTGIVASSQNSRSQNANRETAMMVLKSRISHLLAAQQLDHINDLRGTVKDIAWGNQIRSYVLHPYKMVKDLRSGYETSQVQQVLDGNIMPFIEQQLKQKPS